MIPKMVGFRAFLGFLLLATAALAQQQSIIYPTTAAASATAVPSAHGYTYAGCWNETTQVPNTNGLRALANGNSVSSSAHIPRSFSVYVPRSRPTTP